MANGLVIDLPLTGYLACAFAVLMFTLPFRPSHLHGLRVAGVFLFVPVLSWGIGRPDTHLGLEFLRQFLRDFGVAFEASLKVKHQRLKVVDGGLEAVDSLR